MRYRVHYEFNRACGQACAYCYNRFDRRPAADSKMDARLEEYIMKLPGVEGVDVYLTGGEPLLEWPRLKNLLLRLKGLRNKQNRLFLFSSLRGAGTPFFRFTREQDVVLLINADSADLEQACRRGLRDIPSSRRILTHVLGRGRGSLVDRFKAWRRLGFRDVRIKLPYAPDGLDRLLNKPEQARLFSLIDEAQAACLSRISRGALTAESSALLSLFAQDIVLLSKGSVPCPPCRAGINYFMAGDGNVFPCLKLSTPKVVAKGGRGHPCATGKLEKKLKVRLRSGAKQLLSAIDKAGLSLGIIEKIAAASPFC
ncbi:MAG: 4Fe-4S cluster-binding domain-containing protein [Candidatus Omnitrophota bacterium]